MERNFIKGETKENRERICEERKREKKEERENFFPFFLFFLFFLYFLLFSFSFLVFSVK